MVSISRYQEFGFKFTWEIYRKAYAHLIGAPQMESEPGSCLAISEESESDNGPRVFPQYGWVLLHPTEETR